MAPAGAPDCRKERAGPPETVGVGQAIALEAVTELVMRAQTALEHGDVGGARSVLDSLANLLNRLRPQRGR
jgi:hypothetical protein